ncbi:MAG: hypothetical protein LBQ59_02115 [Candidatus Peribacteria bacterium]|jgi:hypothetical protein|nr:hypothetical protein [Candidatus Peribacteria bacterium]
MVAPNQPPEKIVAVDETFGKDNRVKAIKRFANDTFELRKRIEAEEKSDDVKKEEQRSNANLFGYNCYMLLTNALNLVEIENHGDDDSGMAQDEKVIKEKTEERKKKAKEYRELILKEAFYNLNKFLDETKGATDEQIEKAKNKFLEKLNPAFHKIDIEVFGEKQSFEKLFDTCCKGMVHFSTTLSKHTASGMKLNERQLRAFTDLFSTKRLQANEFENVIPKMIEIVGRAREVERDSYLRTNKRVTDEEKKSFEFSFTGNEKKDKDGKIIDEGGTINNIPEITKSYVSMGLAVIATIFPITIIFAGLAFMIKAKGDNDRNKNFIDEFVGDAINKVFKIGYDIEDEYRGLAKERFNDVEGEYERNVNDHKERVGEYLKSATDGVKKIVPTVENFDKFQHIDAEKFSNTMKYLNKQRAAGNSDERQR